MRRDVSLVDVKSGGDVIRTLANEYNNLFISFYKSFAKSRNNILCLQCSEPMV